MSTCQGVHERGHLDDRMLSDYVRQCQQEDWTLLKVVQLAVEIVVEDLFGVKVQGLLIRVVYQHQNLTLVLW
jgi:hypothetical protein